jgi:uncharacterized SAM-binding protein YcdF (DUF218 family)
MFIFLSKFLPLFVYPVGLTFIFLVFAFVYRQKPKRVKTFLIAALLVLWLGGNRWASKSLVRSLEWQYLPPDEIPHADVIVVLGGGTGPATYPRTLVELNGSADRLVYASWLYHQGAAPKLLLTGGYIPWMGERESSPAEDMAKILEMLDVPQTTIWLETQSLNTYENAIYSREILDREGIDRIILVTSAFHMPRSVPLFEMQGFEVIPAPTDYTITQQGWDELWEFNLTTQVFNLIPSAGNLDNTTWALKEYIGILVYTLRGWL